MVADQAGGVERAQMAGGRQHISRTIPLNSTAAKARSATIAGAPSPRAINRKSPAAPTRNMLCAPPEPPHRGGRGAERSPRAARRFHDPPPVRPRQSHNAPGAPAGCSPPSRRPAGPSRRVAAGNRRPSPRPPRDRHRRPQLAAKLGDACPVAQPQGEHGAAVVEAVQLLLLFAEQEDAVAQDLKRGPLAKAEADRGKVGHAPPIPQNRLVASLRSGVSRQRAARRAGRRRCRR